MKPQPEGLFPPEMVAFYERDQEASRLFHGLGRLEFARTTELLSRFLPAPPAVVCDVGGGPGVYACRLAGQGYEVHLVDAMPLHVEQARVAAELQPGYPLASCSVGDARALDVASASADAVLLLGPLYHLIERADRLAALEEAHRILKPGGVLLAAGITRYASALDGLRLETLADPDFVAIVERDLVDGQHRNPYDDRPYFTTAFFHRPDELASEVEDARFRGCRLLNIEGPGWLMPDFDARWQDPERREILLRVARYLEEVPSLLGIGSHLMAVARR